MRRLSLLVVLTERCNLRCSYCFDADGGYANRNMTITTLKHIFDKAFAEYDLVSVEWHGGEPLLCGKEFFEEAFKTEEECAKNQNCEIENNIQTNGTLLTRELAEFFRDKGVSIGISYDGLDNERNRSQSDEVLRAIELVKDVGVERVGLISILTRFEFEFLLENYNHLNNIGLPFMLNHVISQKQNREQLKDASNRRYEINSLIALFKHWVDDCNCEIVINPYYSAFRAVLLGFSHYCWHSSCMGGWICVKPDESLYPCTRNYEQMYSYGSLSDYTTINEVFKSEGFLELLDGATARRERCMADCKWYRICQGGCNANALHNGSIDCPGGFECEYFRALCEEVTTLIFARGFDPKCYGNRTVQFLIREYINGWLGDAYRGVAEAKKEEDAGCYESAYEKYKSISYPFKEMAEFRQAQMLRKGKLGNSRRKESIEILQRLSDSGNSEAQYVLGLMYFEGELLDQNYAKAFNLHRLVAEKGSMYAQYSIGIMLENGWGCAQDPYRAFYWHMRAARQGYCTAQYRVGCHFYYGISIEKDREQAKEWFERSAQQEFAESENNLAMMLIEDGMYQEGFSMLSRAAEHGSELAKNNLLEMEGLSWPI